MRTICMRSQSILALWRAACLLIAAASASFAHAQIQSAPQTLSAQQEASIAAARALAAAFVQDADLPGLSIAVGIDGKLIWSEGFGFADLEQRTAVTPESRFRIGSVSKTLTATAVGLLVERGKLDLDAPIQRYVPTFPQKQAPISARQLAGHTAGIRNYQGDEFYSSRGYDNVLDSLAIFADDPLIFRPGTDYQYTTYGWSALSAAIEAAAGEPFLSFMEREVFAALGMRHTMAEHMDALIPDRVRYYARDDKQRLRNARYVDNSNKWAGGGFISTPSDLVAFGFDNLRPGLLKPQTVQMLMQPQTLESGRRTDYGIGWQTRSDPHHRTIVGHGGGSVGGSTAFAAWPQERLIVAATTNITEDPGIFALAYALGDIFLQANGAPAPTTSAPETVLAFDSAAAGELKAITGSVLLQQLSPGYRGWISTDGTLPFGRVLWGRAEPEGLHLVATTPKGILNLWLQRQGKEFTGRWLGPDGERRVHARMRR